jgi:hypothetical protein
MSGAEPRFRAPALLEGLDGKGPAGAQPHGTPTTARRRALAKREGRVRSSRIACLLVPISPGRGAAGPTPSSGGSRDCLRPGSRRRSRRLARGRPERVRPSPRWCTDAQPVPNCGSASPRPPWAAPLGTRCWTPRSRPPPEPRPPRRARASTPRRPRSTSTPGESPRSSTRRGDSPALSSPGPRTSVSRRWPPSPPPGESPTSPRESALERRVPRRCSPPVATRPFSPLYRSAC